MFSSEDTQARFDNCIVVDAINSLAETVHSIFSLEESEYNGDGACITCDLDSLVTILLNQIVSCIPREKQHPLLIAHGLEEYCEDLDECWSKYVEFASAEDF